MHSAADDENAAVKLPVRKSLRRLALEIEGWLELGDPQAALERIPPLLAKPGARQVGLYFKTRALVDSHRYHEALAAIEELRPFDQDPDWLDLTEAWCLKRIDRIDGAVQCMQRLIGRSRRSAIGHYNLACYLALLGDTERAIDEVTLACGMSEEFRRHAAEERDLDALRGDPRFDELVGPAPA